MKLVVVRSHKRNGKVIRSHKRMKIKSHKKGLIFKWFGSSVSDGAKDHLQSYKRRLTEGSVKKPDTWGFVKGRRSNRVVLK